MPRSKIKDARSGGSAKKIGVTGGKGGTGKSTFSILLANKFRGQGKKVVLCDCDVECPNDYLLLGRELKDPKEEVFARFPKLDKSKCKKCGLCVEKCRANAIFMPPGGYPVFLHDLCTSCGLCWNICPRRAILVEKKVIGEVFEDKISDDFYLVTGRSVGVIEETAPIVTKVRERGLTLAEKIGADHLILDTAVGMHCGVIRALVDLDLAYAVTEPTPLGAHDLALSLKLLDVLKIPAAIVLNRSDLGKRELIDDLSKESGVEVSFELPHSKSLVEAYSRGELGKLTIEQL
jgi:MinD superfamily P-loop ATPase